MGELLGVGSVHGEVGGVSLASLEAVAHVADGFDVDGVAGVGLDLGPQGGDAAVDAAWGDEDIVAPHGV